MQSAFQNPNCMVYEMFEGRHLRTFLEHLYKAIEETVTHFSARTEHDTTGEPRKKKQSSSKVEVQ